MRIAIVAPFADPEKGAAIVRVNSFCEYFVSHGNTVTIFSPKRSRIRSKNNVVRYNGIIELIVLLMNHNFDVLLGVSPPITHAFFSLIVCKLKIRPFVLDSKDMFTHTATKLGLLKKGSLKFYIYLLMEFFTHKLAMVVLVLDSNIKNLVLKKYGLNNNKVYVAANGVDIELVRKDSFEGSKSRKKLNIPKNSKLLIYMGGLGDEAYIEFLHETKYVIKKYGAHILFLIASDESDIAKKRILEITNTVDELGIQNKFHLVKNVEHNQVYKYLSAADIGVDFWNNLEYFAVPVKILEYLACGLPVIIKSPQKNKSFEEFFKKHDVGYISKDWAGFTVNIEKALSGMELFNKKWLYGKDIIEKFYTRRITNEKVLQLLYGIALKRVKNV